MVNAIGSTTGILSMIAIFGLLLTAFSLGVINVLCGRR